MRWAIPLLILASCGAQTGTPTAKATVLSLEAGLTAGELVAANYATLPPCPATTAVCSDIAVVKTIRESAASAYAAITSAQTLVDADPTGANVATQIAVSAAITALSAFQATLPAVPAMKAPTA